MSAKCQHVFIVTKAVYRVHTDAMIGIDIVTGKPVAVDELTLLL